MIKINWITLLLLNLLTHLHISSQNPRCINYTINNGLPGKEVYHILQDSQGYIWISSDHGVSRFDGHSFTDYTTEDGLMSNTIFFSSEDDQGRIWFLGLSSTLSYYDGTQIRPYWFNPEIEEIIPSKVPKVSFQIVDERIYIGTLWDGYYSINNSGEVNHIKTHPSLNIIKIQDEDLIFKNSAPSRKPSAKNKINIYGKEYHFIRSHQLIPRLVENNGITYFSDGTNIFRIINDIPELLHRSANAITCLTFTSNQKLLVGFKNGGCKSFSVSDSGIFQTAHYLEEESITWVLEDFNKNIWYSTLSNGILFNPSNLGYVPDFESKLPTLKTMDIHQDSIGRVYISYTDGSIWKIDSPGFNVEKIYISKTSDSFKFFPLAMSTDKVIHPQMVNKLFNQNKKQILKAKGKITNRSYSDDIIFRPQIKSFASMDNNLWVGTNEGLYFFRNNRFEHIIYRHSLSNKGIVNPNPKIDDLFISKDSSIYCSTWDGLFKIEKDQLMFLGDKEPLFRKRTNVIDEYNDRTILLGSRGNGLLVKSLDSVYSITKKDGLSSNIVNSITLDKYQNIWLGTSNGLSLIQMKGEKTTVKRNYLFINLPLNDINKLLALDNFLFVGTTEGIKVLNIDSLLKTPSLPIIQLREIKVNNELSNPSQMVELSAKENDITFEFVGISYDRTEQIKYEYRLVGLFSKWASTYSDEVHFNSLPFGTYNFQIRASSDQKTWSEITTVPFKIIPPFWKQWWFILLAIVSLIFTLILLIRYKFRVTKEKIALEKQSIQLELKALRAQLNPHFTFNTLSSIQDYILSHDAMKANDYLSKFAALIRRVLENSRNTKIALSDEIETILMYVSLEQLRFSNKLMFNLKVPPKININEILIPPSLIQPIVENAIVHGIANKKERGTVTITFESYNNGIICIISDDGVGRAASRKMNKSNGPKEVSLGHKITKDRIELLKKFNDENYRFNTIDLYDIDGNSNGTSVEIYIPTH